MERILFPADCAKGWLPTPAELCGRYPLSSNASKFIFDSRETIKKILEGIDQRLILVVGPCSIHDLEAAREYAGMLKELQKEVSDLFFIVMRVYLEKPRTLIGWKGFVSDPYLDSSHDIAAGVRLARQFLRELADKEIPVASELLEIVTAPYFSDLLSWGCIGARTSTSPPHRQMAAGLNFPIGFKNSTDGNIDHAIHAVISASNPHVYMGVDEKGALKRLASSGNPHCHIILRGGEKTPNYERDFVDRSLTKLMQAKQRPTLMIDCSHGNCRKNYEGQIHVFRSVIEQCLEGNRSISGLMLESNLQAGNQPLAHPSKLRYGVSITDPCLDFSTTESLVKEAYAELQHALSLSI